MVIFHSFLYVLPEGILKMRVCCFMVIEKGISLEHRDYLLGSAHSCLQITPSHNQLWGGEKSPIKVHFWHFLTLRYRWPSNSFIIYSTVPAKLVITVMCAYRWKLYIYNYIYIYIFGGYHLIFPYSHGRCLVRSPSFSPYWSPELHLPSSSSRGDRSPGEDRRLHDVPQFQRSQPRGSTPWSLVTGCEKRWDFQHPPCPTSGYCCCCCCRCCCCVLNSRVLSLSRSMIYLWHVW